MVLGGPAKVSLHQAVVESGRHLVCSNPLLLSTFRPPCRHCAGRTSVVLLSNDQEGYIPQVSARFGQREDAGRAWVDAVTCVGSIGEHCCAVVLGLASATEASIH
jgi:hypothetical protein